MNVGRLYRGIALPAAVTMSEPPPPVQFCDQVSSTSALLSSLLGGEEVHITAWNENERSVVDWQERCIELEGSLQRFRDQAAQIRELLREKLADLEQRKEDAEKRADEAERRAQLMEKRLAEATWNASQHGDSCNVGSNIEKLTNLHSEKDDAINTLEQQVEEQKKLRIQDARQVEAKAAKIKEWVTNKLKELEEQNQHLRQQNQKCNEQLELLKNRLTQLSQLSSRSKPRDRASTEDSSRGSFEDRGESDDSLPPEIPERISPTSIRRIRREHSLGEEGTTLREAILREGHCNADSDSDPLYAAVDYSKKKSHTRSAPPRVKLERKKYNDGNASILSSTASEEQCDSEADVRHDSRVDSGSVDVDTPACLTPRSPLTPNALVSISDPPTNGDSSDGTSPHSDGKRKPVPPPRSRVPAKPKANNCSSSPVVSQVQSQPMVSNSEMNGSKHGASSSSSDNYDNVECKISSQKKSKVDQHSSSEKKKIVCADNEIHDYAEIYTPSQELPNFPSRENGDDLEGKPPTPPLHRFPSWESRIYEVAINGISMSSDSLQGTPSTSPNNNSKPSTDPYINNIFPDLNIPVYATVKGRASQIRSMPFTGDSSDSSDNEDTRVTVTTTSSQTTSGETESSLSTGSPSKSGKTTGSSLSPSPAKQNCISPTKSVKRDASIESVLSDDYAIPPDAVSSDTISIVSVEPQAVKMSITQVSPKKESLEKSGYLTKLGGKFKTWRRRWFVLKNGTLSYYKTQNDVGRKPQGQIILDEVCRVNRAEGAATFEISTGKRTYYLTADSINTMEEWVKVLQNVLRRNATRLLLSKEDNKPTIEGWLTKVKHGHSRRYWCVLIGRMFLYFKTPNETTPLGQINMRDARVEEVIHVSDSDEEEQEEDMCKSEYTIGIFPNHQGPTYLLMANKQEMDVWLYHLTVVSSGENLAGTQYEQLIARLMEADGDENSVIWRHPLLLYSKDSISQPLTTLPSEQLQTEAVKLFKSIQLFISVPLDTSGIDYHVALAQNALQQCLTFPELQNEFFCQLIKQTSRHCYQRLGVQQLLLCATQSLFLCDTSAAEKTSPTSTVPSDRPSLTENKLNPPTFMFVQAWQLLALAISLFIPKNRTLWYLRTHLQRNVDSKTEPGKYAIFCQRALERALTNSSRECKPSRMEVLSILLKNPYHHSLPHSIPVHFLNGTYQVVGFDGSTTVEEFIQSLNAEAGIRDTSHSGFFLYSDDPIEKGMEHCLQSSSKLCDVISKWEQALREKHLGKFENTRIIKLMYKNRLCFRQLLKAETDKERLLTAYQINDEVMQGKFPLTRELALELAALMAQIEFGDYNGDKIRGSGGPPTNPQHQLQQVIEKFYPHRYREIQGEKQVIDNIREKWKQLKGRLVLDCVRIYLNCARKWSYCGAKLFSAKLKSGDQAMIWLAVVEDSIVLLDYVTMQPLVRYLYSGVMTFGGCRDDFMLVISSSDGETGHNTERLLFSMSKPKILEMTLLIADYMNALGRPALVPPSPQVSTLSRLEKIRAKIRASNTLPSCGTAVDSPDIVKVAAEADSRLLHRSESCKKRGGSDST
ncbi:uncharacterized protein CG43867-like isoform X2 [Centruroides vittatus]|uniref:uncharacterized protein CG43867-like isoform X2 n=1 Tax=Centruroides vittatus TaxID=120091 RepID=UPI00350F6319